MSVVSSVLSTGSSRWNLNDRFASLMDSIFAIGAGLGVRFVVDAATRHNFKLSGSLVGLWEGVVLLHFLKKMPRSNDPYIAYGVRLFVDFLVTESVARFVVVLIWTGMGMVLADIAPAVWDDAGAKRIWRHFRRDMRTIRKMIPTVAFFPPARTVRFSPSLAPTETVGSEAPTPSAFTPTELTPATNPSTNLPPPTTNYTEATTTTQRRVPGYFPSGYSDTDSLSSIGSPLPQGRRIPSSVDPTRTSRRLSVYPTVLDDSDASSQNGNDLDEGNLSSSASDTSTEVAGPSASSAVPIDTENIPEIEAEEEPPIQVSTEKPEEEADLTTPRSRPIQMPPTPSDSAARWDRDIREQDEPLGQRPKSELLPQIPDFLEEPTSEDWEKIKKEDWMEEKELPPTPTEEPAKEAKDQTTAQKPASEVTPSPEEEDWDTMKSQVLGGGNDETKKADDAEKTQDALPTTNDAQDQQLHHRESQPPPYQDDFDDIYGDEAPPEKPAWSSTNWLDQEETRLREQQEEERRVKEEEEERLRKEALEAERVKKDEEERMKAEEEAARLKKEAEEKAEADRIKAEEEEKQRKKREEAAERRRKEQADADARKKKREEEVAAEKERKRKEEEEKKIKEAEERTKAAEEAEASRQKVREEAEAKGAAEKKRLEEEAAAERKRLEEEATKKKRLDEEAVEKKRLEKEAAEKKRLEEAEAEKKRLEEQEAVAAEKKRLDDEAAAAIKQKRFDDEAVLNAEIARLAAEEDERLKAEAEQQKQQERELKRQEDEERYQQEQADLVAADAALAVALEVELADAVPTNSSNPANGETQQPSDPFSPVGLPAAGAHVIPEQPEYEESVLSEMSEAPGKIQDRLERVILWKAQIVEIESQVRMLKAQVTSATAGGDVGAVAEKTAELQRTEKVLRKMQKKEQRRWDNGVENEVAENLHDTADIIFLDGLTPGDAKKRIQEKLEELLSPAANSLKLTINLAKGKDGKKQTKGLTDILMMFLFLDYTSTDATKISRINIPPEDFATWLTAYRIAATREESEEYPW
ncbi:unnamed protein product [Cyclocybe aegerita]|uniref:Uncharacterized protein n=1 Tax=Cyclocybe aegerita TaxID=1973307 RepID=A0A8S0WNY1_CYCAE|nr:unnamed protein product [Cyclocybe aegerita]